MNVRGAVPLTLSLTGGMFARSFRYTDNQSDNRNFEANGPILGVHVAVYPAAFVMRGFVADLGVSGSYARGFAPDTDDASGVVLTSELEKWHAGLRGRLTLGDHELGIELGYARHRYELRGDEDAETRPCAWNSALGDRRLPLGVSCLFPDVGYGVLAPKVDARLGFGPFSVGAHAGLPIVLESGELANAHWFPNAGGVGLGVGVSAGFRFLERFEVGLGGDFEQYGFDFNPLPAGRTEKTAPGPIAGGAVDRYISARLHFTYALPGRLVP